MKRIFFFLVLVGLAAPVLPVCGQDTLFIQDAFRKAKVGPYLQYFKTPVSISVDSANLVFDKQLTEIRKMSGTHLGIGNDQFWFSFIIKNKDKQGHRLFLELRQPHLTTVSFFEKTANGFIQTGPMGMLLPFNDRPVKHRNLIMPITCAPDSVTQVIISIDQENSLDAPFFLWDEATFHQHDYDINLLFGTFFGILIFCSLLSFFCYLMVGQKVFLWYFLYVTTAGMFLFQEIGTAFQYLYPSIVYFDAPISIQLPVVMFMLMIKFSQEFLKTSINQKRLHLLLNGIVIFYLILIVLGWLVNDFMRSISLWLLPLVSLVMLVGHVVLIYVGVRFYKISATSSLLYLTATGSVILSGIYNILSQSIGLLSTDINPLFLAILIEVVLLSSALILQYGVVQRERAKLKNDLAEQKSSMFEQHIISIERERNRIASDLHDNIGSRLSSIKRQYFEDEKAEITQELGSLINEVRNLSHDLAPTTAKISGLMPLVERLVMEMRKSSKVDAKLQVFSFKEVLPVESTIQVYRVLQEALNNIVKYAQATRVDIQFFGYDMELVITIEDDGIGFNPNRDAGFGINSMKTRVALLKGKIEINSSPGKGCMIVVEVPWHLTK